MPDPEQCLSKSSLEYGVPPLNRRAASAWHNDYIVMFYTPSFRIVSCLFVESLMQWGAQADVIVVVHFSLASRVQSDHAFGHLY